MYCSRLFWLQFPLRNKLFSDGFSFICDFFFSCSFQHTFFVLLNVLTMTCYGDFLFCSCLFGIWWVSSICIVMSLLSLGKFSSMIFLKIWFVPLTWNCSPSPMILVQRFILLMVSYISCMSLSWVLKLFHSLWLFGLDLSLYLWMLLLFCLLFNSFSLEGFPRVSNWDTEVFNFILISLCSLQYFYPSLNSVFKSWITALMSQLCVCDFFGHHSGIYYCPLGIHWGACLCL